MTRRDTGGASRTQLGSLAASASPATGGASAEELVAIFQSLDRAWTALAERGRVEPFGMATSWQLLEDRYRAVAEPIPEGGVPGVVAAILRRQAILIRQRVELEREIRPLVRGWRRLPDLSRGAREAREAFDRRADALRELDRRALEGAEHRS